MKITIELEERCAYDDTLGIWVRQDGERVPTVTLHHVQQFALCGVRFHNELFREPFWRAVIGDPNELVGMLKKSMLDVLDLKEVRRERVNADSD